ncbi:hypothetical protein M427DRAFT_66931 [Gonapodya prolifera JEL478]|uniref:Uncharacterized protein n=1 Tax=Gonapodya prolifera (strain JEL478) TaxID=1344416 RepID=A0A139ASV0_GONPJ|nr:hypothetical protein M427DRAFT_66931 [Gonapodya prolifera JEL478]|eukprot:KXS19811.1 hypothetical protein M427DRAFT_66931 [Gonapodya prolifera JEL478]
MTDLLCLRKTGSRTVVTCRTCWTTGSKIACWKADVTNGVVTGCSTYNIMKHFRKNHPHICDELLRINNQPRVEVAMSSLPPSESQANPVTNWQSRPSLNYSSSSSSQSSTGTSSTRSHRPSSSTLSLTGDSDYVLIEDETTSSESSGTNITSDFERVGLEEAYGTPPAVETGSSIIATASTSTTPDHLEIDAGLCSIQAHILSQLHIELKAHHTHFPTRIDRGGVLCRKAANEEIIWGYTTEVHRVKLSATIYVHRDWSTWVPADPRWIVLEEAAEFKLVRKELYMLPEAGNQLVCPEPHAVGSKYSLPRGSAWKADVEAVVGDPKRVQIRVHGSPKTPVRITPSPTYLSEVGTIPLDKMKRLGGYFVPVMLELGSGLYYEGFVNSRFLFGSEMADWLYRDWLKKMRF